MTVTISIDHAKAAIFIAIPLQALMSNSNLPASQLFTVRVWQEKVSEEGVEVRFQVTHLLSEETRVFRNSDALLSYLKTKLVDMQSGQVAQ